MSIKTVEELKTEIRNYLEGINQPGKTKALFHRFGNRNLAKEDEILNNIKQLDEQGQNKMMDYLGNEEKSYENGSLQQVICQRFRANILEVDFSEITIKREPLQYVIDHEAAAQAAAAKAREYGQEEQQHE